MIKIFRKIDELTDKLIEYEELKKFEKKIKNYCKTNKIDKKDLQKYINLNKEIFKKVCDPNSLAQNTIKDIDLEIAKSQILNRVYELNKEFLSALKRSYFNTQNALIRQIIELYLISFQIKEDNDYAKVLTGNYEKHKGFPSFKEIMIKLKKDNEKINKDYVYYSGNFHPKTDSFMKNLLLVPPNFIGRVIIPPDTSLSEKDLLKIKKYDAGFAKSYYGNKKLMNKGWQLATITKNSAGPNSHKIIEDFMFYVELIHEKIS